MPKDRPLAAVGADDEKPADVPEFFAPKSKPGATPGGPKPKLLVVAAAGVLCEVSCVQKKVNRHAWVLKHSMS